MLEGKELEGKIGNVGSYSVDVDDSLNVKIEAIISTEQSGVLLESKNAVSAPLLMILEKACLKNNVTWDETVIGGLKMLLKIA